MQIVETENTERAKNLTAMARLFGSDKIERTPIAMGMARLLGGGKIACQWQNRMLVTKSKRETKLGQNRKKKSNIVTNEMKTKQRLKCWKMKSGDRKRKIERRNWKQSKNRRRSMKMKLEARESNYM